MKDLLSAVSALALATAAAPAAAQHADHQMPKAEDPHAGHEIQTPPPPREEPVQNAEPADAHAGHESAPATDDIPRAVAGQHQPGAATATTDPHEGHTAAGQRDYAGLTQSQAGHADHAMMAALGPYPMTRESSGTAWQPDTSAHMGAMSSVGGWTLMGHGVLNLVLDRQGSRRGADKAFASGMVMGMARRPLGNGMLQVKGALSPDPLMGKRGYPLLLASGETADGEEHLIDRQHPHDVFMELSASVSQNLGPKSSIFLYGGLPGEPAFGPPAFMHREAIMDSPEAPISHHWLDSTHITFGVVTAGLVLDRVKLEASRFNAREPDQYRWNIETGPLDSTALRLSWNPTEELSLQGSWGKFIEPEQLEPGVDQKRWSASALYSREVSPGLKFSGTLAWGRKTIDHHGETWKDDAFVAEASLKSGAWTGFTRGEITENRELLEAEEHGPSYRVGKVSVGAVRDFRVAEHLSLGAGGLVSVNFVGRGLEEAYGTRNPLGAMAFVRLKLD